MILGLNWKTWAALFVLVMAAIAQMSDMVGWCSVAVIYIAMFYLIWYCFDSYQMYKTDNPGMIEEEFSKLLKAKLEKSK